jgi:hypothetical protein
VYRRLEELHYQQQHGKSIEQIIQRIKFSLKDEKRTAILEKISKYNKKLEVLLNFSVASPTPTYEHKLSTKRAPHVRLRPLMHNLYQTMGKLWPCDCSLQHKARLCLLACPGQPTLPDASSTVYFNLLMSIQDEASDEYCSWLESKICVSLDGYDHYRSYIMQMLTFDRDSPPLKTSKVKFVLSLPQHASSTSRPALSLTRPQPGPALSRTPPGPTPEPTPPTSPEQLTRTLSDLADNAKSINQRSTQIRPNRPVSPPSPSTTSPTTPSLDPIRIENICRAMPKQPHPKICPQMHFDGDVLWKMRPTQDKLFVEASRPGKSLAELLREERPFNLRERRILAVILAHSLLHFCDSPWLSRHWDKKHLEFFHRSTNGGKLDIQRPWLATDFETSEPPEDIDRFVRIHPNPSVLALGILLLEIELRSSIESQRTEDDYSVDGKVDCNTDYFTADRLLKADIMDVYDGYKGAVQACLTCKFVDYGKSMSLDDQGFRQAVYEHIVLPLEEELFHGYGLKPEDLGLELA